MVKVVINICFGGFGISRECVELMAKDGHAEAIKELEAEKFYGYVSDNSDKDRTDPILVKAVEALGSKKASGRSAQLSVVEIPDCINWYIEEYDGRETVRESHRSWM